MPGFYSSRNTLGHNNLKNKSAQGWLEEDGTLPIPLMETLNTQLETG